VSVTVGVLARLEGLEPPTHDLEARQLSPCFPPVAGPGVRSRVRIASRVSATDKAYLLRLGGMCRKAGEAGLSAEIVSLRRDVLDVGSSPCPRRARALPDSDSAPCGLRDTPCRIARHALNHAWEIKDRAHTPSREGKQPQQVSASRRPLSPGSPSLVQIEGALWMVGEPLAFRILLTLPAGPRRSPRSPVRGKTSRTSARDA
jgi:hypothetical protein